MKKGKKNILYFILLMEVVEMKMLVKYGRACQILDNL